MVKKSRGIEEYRIDFHVKTKVKEQMRFYITWFEPSEWLTVAI